MAGLQTQTSAAAVALLSAAGDPERTIAAIARIEEKEDHAREAAKVARAEITLLEKTRKEIDTQAKAMEVARAKSEQDLVSRQASMDKLEESIKRRDITLKNDRATLRAEQKTHKETSRIEMDRFKNLEIALSGKEKGLAKEQTKLYEQASNLKIAIVTANDVKAQYEDKVAKLTAALAD